MSPGPRPKTKATDDYHVRLNKDQRKTLDNMGFGRVPEKILYLIDKEAERQIPTTKIQMLSKWQRDRKEAMRFAAQTTDDRKRLIEMGVTPEHLDEMEDE